MSQDRKPGRVRVVSTSGSSSPTPPAVAASAPATVAAGATPGQGGTGAKRADRTPVILALLFLAGAAAGGIGTVASGLAR